jgi:hypothetical protein
MSENKEENINNTSLEPTVQTQIETPMDISPDTPTNTIESVEQKDLSEEEKRVQYEAVRDKFRNISVNFINNNKNELVKIYLQHNKSDGKGVLGINLENIETTQKIDVAYIPEHILTSFIIHTLNERSIVNNENIIYFLLITPFEEQIIEIDIRTLTQ